MESADFLEGGKKFFSQDFLKTYGFFEDYDVQIKDDLNKIETELNGKYSVDCKD